MGDSTDSEQDFELDLPEDDEDLELDEDVVKAEQDVSNVVYLTNAQRRTPSRTTVFEKSKILSVRSSMVTSGTDLYCNSIGPDTLQNVEQELKERRCPVYIERKFTMGKQVFIERYSANDLTFQYT